MRSRREASALLGVKPVLHERHEADQRHVGPQRPRPERHEVEAVPPEREELLRLLPAAVGADGQDGSAARVRALN